MKKYMSIIFVIGVLGQCKPKPPQEEVLDFAYLQQNCVNCHAWKESSGRAAPSLADIRNAYRETTENEESFRVAILSYIQEPGTEKSVRKEWADTYGVMPKMGFSIPRLKSSLGYLYRTDWESDEWKEKMLPYIQDPKKSAKILQSNMTPIEKAQVAAMQTKSTLGSNLMKAMQEKGVEGALGFCNEKAIPITEDMSEKLGYTISRVSDRPRNSNNQANEKEIAIIQEFKTVLLNQGKLSPRETKEGDITTVYFPIQTNEACLKCHGVVDRDIQPQVHKKISDLYPKDKAVGYSSGEIRGLFKVVMD